MDWLLHLLRSGFLLKTSPSAHIGSVVLSNVYNYTQQDFDVNAATPARSQSVI